jgi:hypothetical protein
MFKSLSKDDKWMHAAGTVQFLSVLYLRAMSLQPLLALECSSQVVGTRRKYPDLSVQHGLACGDAVTQTVGRTCLQIFWHSFSRGPRPSAELARILVSLTAKTGRCAPPLSLRLRGFSSLII